MGEKNYYLVEVTIFTIMGLVALFCPPFAKKLMKRDLSSKEMVLVTYYWRDFYLQCMDELEPTFKITIFIMCRIEEK